MRNLTGTEKQIKWANDLLTFAIEMTEARIYKFSKDETKVELVEKLRERLAFLETIESAEFVIENRDILSDVSTELK